MYSCSKNIQRVVVRARNINGKFIYIRFVATIDKNLSSIVQAFMTFRLNNTIGELCWKVSIPKDRNVQTTQ
jgi:hypothetical protein